MGSTGTALDADWLGAARVAADALRRILRETPRTRERAVETGQRGEGGDRTLVIDQAAEDAVFAQLDLLHAAGHRFTAVSEERGEVDYGGDGVRVVIDPIDGSLNAKRLLPSAALSIAVADGPTMADVAFGFVHDYGTGEEWTAVRNGGAFLDGVALDPSLPERRGRSGKLEVLGVEVADPRWIARSIDGLQQETERLRVLGAMALTICQVAAARLDGMISLRRCRAVDAAAAQLIVREAGGHVAFPLCGGDGLAAPLDVEPHSPIVCARSPASLAALARVVA
ncbi:inositol monophosphatase family protein [Conexibacter sp. JD483]|uniref:inositol monophosphatase family protein n=1 Tax=unclassified Conexibacter TaxID=2627773 RepID=UPI00271B76CF|nr:MULTISPECIES: inositol monophosphatase family protein [unclassified Conexibacter]MDO8184314.1 inositol monophosphatase family protein [Conexibacter sp. CPCC 205706]MDO8197620.1 inositol monophosphatase family protein [Conexibacter sp. CPCC 205762]MDR9369613.1 inositol monophosphatase family protein [Conexibacter sp. JD483]